MLDGILQNTSEFSTPFSLIRNAFTKFQTGKDQLINELKREIELRKEETRSLYEKISRLDRENWKLKDTNDKLTKKNSMLASDNVLLKKSKQIETTLSSLKKPRYDINVNNKDDEEFKFKLMISPEKNVDKNTHKILSLKKIKRINTAQGKKLILRRETDNKETKSNIKDVKVHEKKIIYKVAKKEEGRIQTSDERRINTK